jgi:serine/threonine-protein kinase
MQSSAARQRFHREARLAARLNHPGIVRVLASGELAPQSSEVGGEAFLASEYLDGASLRTLLQQRQCLPLTDAIALMLAASDAVGEAHDQQIIHRDLKPENLMLVPEESGQQRIVVLDFGLARALDHDQDPLTNDGAILGTPQYMSPEAAHGNPATPRSDVYALATILYELLTGRPPFAAASPMLVLMQQASAAPPPLAAVHAVPAQVQELVLRELAKSPDDRSPTARDFAATLFSAARAAGLPRPQLLLPQLSDEFLERVESA